MILTAMNPADRRRCRHVYLDGVDVTRECEIVVIDEPDEAGAVRLLKRNADGHADLDPITRRPVRAWHFGHVVISGGGHE